MNLFICICKDGYNYMGNRDYISQQTGIPTSTISHKLKNADSFTYYDGSVIKKFKGAKAKRHG